MTIITPTGITGINSITSSGSTLSFQNVSGGNINVSGVNISSGTNINISGVSTFTSGPVLIGSGTSTGTASQTLQVTGGTYISGNLGIGTINPQERVHFYSPTSTNFIRLDNGSSATSYYGLNSSGDVELNAATNNNLIFKTFGTERARLDSSGNFKLSTAGTKILNSSGNPILQQTGSILQVVQSICKTTWSSSSDGTSFYQVTPYTATITPSSSTSKILVMMQMHIGFGYWEIQGRITRNGSPIVESYGDARGSRTRCSFAAMNYDGQSTYGYNWITIGYDYLDSPTTTSATTYGVQLNGYSTYSLFFNRTGFDYDTADYYGQPASTITLMEVSA
jgi:hypothetical protein